MGGRWLVIVLLLLGAWQLVGTLIEKAGKKQQEQRLKDLAAQRQRQVPGRTPSKPAPRRPTATERAQGLAARRREQLEQLRQRRAAQQPGVQVPPTRTPTARPAPAPPPAAGRHTITKLPSTPYQAPPTRQRAPAPVARRPAPQPAAPGTVRPAPPTPRPAPARPVEPPPIEGESSTRRVVMDAEEIRPAAKQRHLPMPFVPGEPLGPHLLRQMVVFREILDPPVALRDRQAWERV